MVERALDPEPARRFPSARMMGSELVCARGDLTTSGRRKLLLASASLVASALILFASGAGRSVVLFEGFRHLE
jgi:hypothetical protein